MEKSEVADLLALVTAFDRRTTGEADDDAWLLVLADYRMADAVAALRQFKHDQPGVWVEPGHLAQIIDGWEEQWRWQGHPGPMPPGGRHGPEDEVIMTPDGPVPLLEFRRAQRAIGGGPGEVS